MSLMQEIEALYQRRGNEAYFGECISLTEHGLQAAFFARANQAPPALVIAALLHDIGHLLDDVPADIAQWQTDARHEEVGSRWLAQYFGPEVYEPVRLHVPAKRYLCATHPNYLAKLSDASVLTLKLQGGPMSPAEVTQFESRQFHADAVRVRRWDDLGKVLDLKIPSLHEYAALINALAS